MWTAWQTRRSSGYRSPAPLNQWCLLIFARVDELCNNLGWKNNENSFLVQRVGGFRTWEKGFRGLPTTSQQKHLQYDLKHHSNLHSIYSIATKYIYNIATLYMKHYAILLIYHYCVNYSALLVSSLTELCPSHLFAATVINNTTFY